MLMPPNITSLNCHCVGMSMYVLYKVQFSVQMLDGTVRNKLLSGKHVNMQR